MILQILMILCVVGAMYRKRGWYCPLIAWSAVIVWILLMDAVAISTLGLELALSSDSQLHGLLISLYAGICTILVYALCAQMLPSVNPRAMTKTSRLPFRTFGCLILFGGAIFAIANASEASDVGQAIASVFFLIVFSFSAAISFFNLATRQRLNRRQWERLSATPHPLLYLRSFTVDALGGGLREWFTFQFSPTDPCGRAFDQVLDKAFSRVGFLVALGNPEDYLPTPGACKVYPGDEQWQSCVDSLVRHSGAVFVVEGATEGLKWELEYVRSQGDPERVFVLTLPRKLRKRYGKNTKTDPWVSFDHTLESVGFPNLGPDPGAGSVLTFDNDWSPRVIAQGLASARAYQRVFEEGIPKPKRVHDPSAIRDVVFTGMGEDDVQTTIGMKRLVFILDGGFSCLVFFCFVAWAVSALLGLTEMAKVS